MPSQSSTSALWQVHVQQAHLLRYSHPPFHTAVALAFTEVDMKGSPFGLVSPSTGGLLP